LTATAGKLYLVKIAVNDKSEKSNLHLADLEPYPGGQAAPATPTAPTTPATPSVSSLPPPRPPAPPPGPAAPRPPVSQTHAADDVWVFDGQQPVRMSLEQLTAWITSHNYDPKDVSVSSLLDPHTWKPAAEVFANVLPF
jgi:hypothetical protein